MQHYTKNQPTSYNPRNRPKIDCPYSVYGYSLPHTQITGEIPKQATLVKIGSTNHFLRRMDEWQVDDGYPLAVWFCVPTTSPKALQNLVHLYFDKEHLSQVFIQNKQTKHMNKRIQWFAITTPFLLPMIASMLEQYRTLTSSPKQCITLVHATVASIETPNFKLLSIKQIELPKQNLQSTISTQTEQQFFEVDEAKPSPLDTPVQYQDFYQLLKEHYVDVIPLNPPEPLKKKE